MLISNKTKNIIQNILLHYITKSIDDIQQNLLDEISSIIIADEIEIKVKDLPE